MFPRSERFVDKIEVTPGPNHYDIKANEDDPYKRFGFLGKTKRFGEDLKGSATNCQAGGLAGLGAPYERNGLSTSLPSLVIDDDTSVTDTASVHSNGSTTPDHNRRPSAVRSKSSDKLGLTFAASTNKVEERLKKELTDLTDKFEKFRIARQRDLDVMGEKQKKAEAMYQSAVKDKNSIQTQLVCKESEIAELGARHNMLKTTLEKSEKAATLVNDKIGKTNQLQKKVDDLERILARTRLSLQEHESNSNDVHQKLELQRRQWQQQLDEQKEAAEQEVAHANERYRLAEQHHEEEMQRTREDSDMWRVKFEELERLFKELERKLEAEQRTVEELRESMKKERECLQEQIDRANDTIQRLEREKQEMESKYKEKEARLENEKSDLDRSLQSFRKELEEMTERHQATEKLLAEQRTRNSEAVDSMTRQYEEQQAQFAKERQEHAQARQGLEQSIVHLTTELGQSCNALAKVQQERAVLQDKFNESQSHLQEMSSTMTALEGQYELLKESSAQEQEKWSAKYDTLSAESASQRQESDAAIADLKVTLDQRTEDLSRLMRSVDTIQAELKIVDSQREEVIAQKMEEERKAAETLVRLAMLEEENLSVSQQLASLGENSQILKNERDQWENESQVKGQSIKSLETEIELITSETKEREAQDQKRIKELEDMHHSAAKESDLLRQKEKAWELENAKSLENAASQNDIIGSLQFQLERSGIEREVESRASAERIKELEARCRAMESAFIEMFEKSGSTQKIDETQPLHIWQQHSAAVLDILVYHTTECSISKTEYTALVEEKSALEQSSAALAATLQEQEAAFKKAQMDHSGLLTKIAELEDRIRHLATEVEFLEVESIGKVAIIKALQDEYDYQEKVIRDLSKNEDAGKEVARLEEELRMMTGRTQETEVWIKEVKEDNEKYRQAYVKADVAREATLLDMAKLHEELAESEQARLQVENQLQTEVSAMIKKHGLTGDELSRLSKMKVDSAQNLNLKQKIMQVVQLKEEVLTLKKKNLGLTNTRDSLRLKCLQVERELEAYKAANVLNASPAPAARTGAGSCASSVVSSSSTVRSVSATAMVTASDQTSGGKLQLQGLAPAAPSASRSRSTSPGTTKPSNGVSQPAVRSRAARSFMAGHSTTS